MNIQGQTTSEFTGVLVVAAIGIAIIFITIMSFVKEPHRQSSKTALRDPPKEVDTKGLFSGAKKK